MAPPVIATVSWVARLCSLGLLVGLNIAPTILAAPNRRSLATCLVGSPETHFFSLGAAFLSLAPSSAKGYYATGPANFKLGVQRDHEDPYQSSTSAMTSNFSPRSKVKVTRSFGPSVRCWPISQEQKVRKIPKLIGIRLYTHGLNAHQFQVQ